MAQDQVKNRAVPTPPPLGESTGQAKASAAVPDAGNAAAKPLAPPPLPGMPVTSAAPLAAPLPPALPTATATAPPPLETKAATPEPPSVAEPRRKTSATKAGGTTKPKSLPAPSNDDADDDDVGGSGPRRTARRRPAGPARSRIAANDDVPSIGGLIYSLEQKPSNEAFKYAGIASAVWLVLALTFAAFSMWSEAASSGWATLLAKPSTLILFAAVVVPIAIIWFLALLGWRAEELRLRSSTMTEVAIRLAEPDRMAEDQIASLGQAVRRQVGFMNEAVGRAIGRAGELESLVHHEVAHLEQSYEENERRIRGLIQELASERHALTATSGSFNETLRTLGSEVPALIEKLSNQQVNLAKIIQGAADNLTSLETTLNKSVGSLEGQLGTRTTHLQNVLEGYTGALNVALGARTDQMQIMLEDHTSRLGEALTGRTDTMQQMLEAYTTGLAGALGARTEQMQIAFGEHMEALDTAIANRTGNLQTVFEEYARALDSTLAVRSESLDSKLVERTRALDASFNERLRLFDDTIQRTTFAIDRAVEDRAQALTNALDTHARTFADTIARQSLDLDESLTQGITSVRRTSENITRQSLKAIETLAGQSDMLKSVSENLLGQINNVTRRFESQGQSIMQAANALESANYKIDQTLQARHSDLTGTLDRLSGKANEFSRYIEDYSSTIEGSIGAAEQRARAAAEELMAGTQSHRQIALGQIERLRSETESESARALAELNERLNSVSNQVSSQLGSLSSRFDETSEDVRLRAMRVTEEMSREQARISAELERLPQASRASSEAMRRSLQDQIKALDQLSSLTSREAHRRDVSLPVANGGNLAAAPAPSTTAPAAAMPNGGATQRSLSSLSASLAKELGQRGTNAPAPAPSQAAAPQTTQTYQQPAPQQAGMAPPAAAMDGREAWSLGDLLKRASRDEEAQQQQRAATPQQVQQAQYAQPASSHPAPAQAQAPFNLNIEVLSRALDPATAAVIWTRLKSGQRGIMVRSIYSAEGRNAFDEVSRRYPSDPGLQATVNRYLGDFERILRDTDAKDPSGRMTQTHMTSATGRVYLFLAHASGRLS